MMYLIIFIAKVIEVTLATVRIVLITKGERLKGSVVALFEITLWVILAGSVLNDIASDPMKGVVYVLGFVVGNYLGSWLEEKIAIGTTTIEFIVPVNEAHLILEKLKSFDLGFTVVDAHGQISENKIIIAYVARKRKNEILKSIQELNSKCFITVNETKGTVGGYGLKKR